MDTLRKIRTIAVAAMFKIHKNRFKDKFLGHLNPPKWPKEDHDEAGGRTWDKMEPELLTKKLYEEAFELEQDLLNRNRRPHDMLLEGGDVTVLAMMMCDRGGVFEDGILLQPKVVCLCGSTKFRDAFQDANFRETMAGNIVLSVGFFMHSEPGRHVPTVMEKEKLDDLHKRKIDLADEILVLNVGGYVGDSTRSEIKYALNTGKPIRWLEKAPEELP